MLHDMGIDTGIDLDRLIEAARLAQRIVGRELPSACCAPGRGPGRGVTTSSARDRRGRRNAALGSIAGDEPSLRAA